MRVAIITKSASIRSGARVPFELAPELAKYASVTVFVRSDRAESHLKRSLADKGIEFIFYNNPFDLYQKLTKGGFDVISFHSTLPEIIACKLTGIPIVKTYYGTQFDAYLERFTPDDKPNLVQKIVNMIFNHLIWLDQKLQVLLSDQVIAISEYTQKELLKLYHQPSELIYLGTNFKPSVKLVPKRGGQYITVLAVSRITPYKGFHLLLQCIHQLRMKGIKIKTIITGSSPKNSYLEYLKSIKGKDDKILLNVSDEKLMILYQTCDIFVSLDKYLFFGLPIVEASIFGKPTVALNFAAARELVDHGKSGFIADSIDQFQKYLEILSLNPKIRQNLGRQARERVLKYFNLEEKAYQYYPILKRFVKNKEDV